MLILQNSSKGSVSDVKWQDILDNNDADDGYNKFFETFYSLAAFKSVVKDTKSNTKNITKSISIHSDYQGVHFW